MFRKLLARKNRALAGASNPVGQAGRSHRLASQTSARASVLIENLEARELLSSYYISATGNDSAAGTSTATAWKTIAKVNSVTFRPGDSILFQGGKTFSGTLNFDTNDGNGGSNSVKISSYGTGRATINGGSGNGIYVYRTAGFDINNINVVGNGALTSGIGFVNPRLGGIDYSYIRISNVDVSGFGFGVYIVSNNDNSGFNDVRITGVNAFNNKEAGIATTGASWYHPHSNVYVGYCRAYNNFGTFRNAVSGSGIFTANVDTLMIEHCLAYNNGASGGDGNYGVFVAMANKVVVQFNESYGNISRGGRDGGGFDFDFGVTNAVCQYNYSHGNSGNGYGLAEVRTWDNLHDITLRYNVSENDGRSHADTGIKIWGTARDIYIYNNTVFTSPSVNNGAKALRFHNALFPSLHLKNIYVRNNIFVTTGTTQIIDITSGILQGSTNIQFQNNLYYNYGGKPVIGWGGVSYTSLAAFQATGQEKLNGAPVGMLVDPQLNNPGGGGTIGNANLLYNLTAYQLKPTSPALNKGLNLKNLTGTSAGSVDFFGTPLYQGSGFDLGADEWGGYNGPPQIAVAAPAWWSGVSGSTSGSTGGTTGGGTTTTLAVPTGVTAAKNTSTKLLEVKWNASAGATTYRVQFRKVGTTTWNLAYQGTATVKAFSSLAAGSYEFQVAAGNGTSWSAWTASVLATI